MSFGVGVCMRNPCPPFVSKEGSRDRIYALKERVASQSFWVLVEL